MHTSLCISFGFRRITPPNDVFYINRDSRLRKEPEEVLDLVLAVLVLQELDEVLQKLVCVFDEKPAGITEIGIVRVEDVGCQQCTEIDDKLFI